MTEFARGEILLTPRLAPGFDRQLAGQLRRPAERAAASAGDTAGRGFANSMSGALQAVGGFIIARRVGRFFRSTVDAALEFETAFTGVRKTVDASEAEFGQLEQDFRDLATEIPASAAEISGVAEVAGQLGVAAGDITEFTETMIALGESTVLSAEEAATALARFSTIMQEPIDNVERLGDTVVALGNSFELNEAELLNFASRIAGAGKIAGLTSDEVFGIATAFASIGVGAEAGGTAVQKVLLAMVEAVEDGGDTLETFAETAGVSAEEFARLFREDAAGAFEAFVLGLGEQGTAATRTLDALNLSDQRLARSFLSLAGAGDRVTETLSAASEAASTGGALQEEFGRRLDTNAARLEIMSNRFNDLKIDIGGTLANAALPFLDVLTKIPAPALAAGVAIAGMAASAVVLVRVMEALKQLSTLKIIQRLGAEIAAARAAGAVSTLSAAVGGLGRSLASLARFAVNPVTLAVGAAIAIFASWKREKDRLKAATDQLTEALQAEADGVEGAVDRVNVKLLQERELLDDVTAAGVSLSRVLAFMRGETQLTAVEIERLNDVQSVASAFGDAVTMSYSGAGEQITSLADATEEARKQQALLNDITETTLPTFREYTSALLGIPDAADQTGEGLQTLTEDAEDLVAGFDDLETAASDVGKAFNAALGPTLSLEEAEDRLVRSKKDLRRAIKENGDVFKGNTKRALDNRDALRDVVENTFALVEAQVLAGETTPEAAQQRLLNIFRNLRRTTPEARTELQGYIDLAKERFPAKLASSVEVNTRAAQRKIDAFLRSNEGKEVTARIKFQESRLNLSAPPVSAPSMNVSLIRANELRISGTLSRGTATGGLVTPTATGGMVARAQTGLGVGPRRAGDLLLVGERGPELFAPSGAGEVLSNQTLVKLLREALAGIGDRFVRPVVVNEVAQDPIATARAVSARLGAEAVR